MYKVQKLLFYGTIQEFKDWRQLWLPALPVTNYLTALDHRQKLPRSDESHESPI